MNEHASRTSSNRDLIEALIQDLKPVAPVRLVREILRAALIQLSVVALEMLLTGWHLAGSERLNDPAFLGLLLALLLGAATSAVTMSRLSIPGRGASSAIRTGVLVLPLLLAGFVVAVSPWGGSWSGLTAVLVEGFGCTRSTILMAAPAWLAGLASLRRLRPLDPLRVGLFCATTALLLAAVAVQMSCPSCDSWHLALSHYVPLLVAAWVAAMVSPLFLKTADVRG